MKNPFLRRQEKRGSGHAGQQSEKKLAKRIGAQEVPGSGAGRVKGDLKKDDFLIEAKSTVKGSFSVRLDVLRKIASEAQLTDRNPAFAFTFTDAEGRPERGGSWIAVPEWLWKEMFE